jgi:hypothetical protein
MMPLMRCGENGKGWKFGSSGKCYEGKDAKSLAIKQGVKIYGPEKFKKIMDSEGIIKEDLLDIMSDKDTTDEEFSTLADVLGLSMNEQIGLNVKRIKGSE